MLDGHYNRRFVTLLNSLFRNSESISIRSELREFKKSIGDLEPQDAEITVYFADQLRSLPPDLFKRLIESAVSFFYVVRIEDLVIQKQVAKYLVNSPRLMSTIRNQEVARSLIQAVAQESSLRSQPAIRWALVKSAKIDIGSARVVLKSCDPEERRRMKASRDVMPFVRKIISSEFEN